MSRYLYVFLGFMLLTACRREVEEDARLRLVFDAARVQGNFGLYDVQNNSFKAHHFKAYRDSMFSSFNASYLLLTLMALETGVLYDEQRPLVMGRSSMNVKTAFEKRDTAFFRMLAARMDTAHLRKYIDSVHFGVYSAALPAPLILPQTKLSSDQLLGFIKKFYSDQLPFQQRTMALAYKVFLTYQSVSGDVYYIDGGRDEQGRRIVLGWLEQRKRPYFFVLNITQDRLNNEEVRSFLLRLLEKIALLEHVDGEKK